MGHHHHPKLWAAGLLLSLLVATGVEARTVTITWDHPDDAQVVGFQAHWGLASRSVQPYTGSADLGKPAASGGVYTATIEVPEERVYVAIRAYDDQSVSGYSNELIREAASGGGDPGDPPGDPGDPPASAAAVEGFVLWNASTGSVIDASFQNGDTIDLAAHGNCLAIQVIGNAYLEQSGSPGSMLFAFDAPIPPTCSDRENAPPFAWERDNGPGQFECAPSLTALGAHVLRVLPYDADDCGGVAGSEASVAFEIIDSGSGGGGPALTAPGQPYIIE